LLNWLLALVCKLETTFSAFKNKKLDRFNTKEGFLELEEDIVLDTSANDKYDLVIEVRIVIDEGEKIVNDNNNPVKKIHKER